MTSVNYSTQKLTVAPGGVHEIVRHGEFITCLSASHPFRVSFDAGARSDFQAGLTFRVGNIGFKKLAIYNPRTDTDLVIEIGLGVGDLKDGRLTLGGEIDNRSRSPDTLMVPLEIALPTGVVTPVVPSNPDRSILYVRNDGVNSAFLVPPGTAFGTKAIELQPGYAASMSYSGPLDAWPEVGNAILNVVELEFGT